MNIIYYLDNIDYLSTNMSYTCEAMTNESNCLRHVCLPCVNATLEYSNTLENVIDFTATHFLYISDSD